MKILREIMALRGFTYQTLAEKCGYKTHTGVSTKMERANGMRVDTLLKFLNAMDCELVIRSKLSDKSEWKVVE